MVTFDKRRNSWCGRVSKEALEVVQNLLDVLAWGISQSIVFISEEVTSKMEFDGVSSFELELVVIGEGVDQSLSSFADNAEVIHVYYNVFIVISHVSHPDVSFSFGRKES